MKVVLIPGDGIGKEISESVKKVSEVLKTNIEWETHSAGAEYYEKSGKLFDDDLMDAIQNTGIALKGPTATPIGTGFRSINVQLRQRFSTYANLRPVHSITGVKSRYEDVDLVIVNIIFTCKIIIEESQRKYGNHTLSQSKNTNIKSFSKQDSTSEKYTNEIENNVLVKNKPIYYSDRKVKDSSSLKSIYTNRDSITLQSIICVDTETTGKYSGRDEILQLAIIDGTGKILFNELIKPARRKRWPEAQEINGITPAMVKDKQPLLFYEHKLNAIFYSASVIVGYNLKFDLDFLKKGGIDGAYNEYDSHLYYDVMEKFAPIYGQYDVYHGDFRWKKLKTCARYYKYQWDGKPHDALADAKATLHCFMVMTGLKSLPVKTNKQSNKPSYQKVWKEFSENKTGKRLRFNDFNKIVELVEKWAELAGVKKDSISFSKVTDKSKILIKYNGSFLLEVRMPTTMNYIKMSDEMMKSVPPTSTQLNMLCFYSFEDLQLNHELKAYCIKKIRS